MLFSHKNSPYGTKSKSPLKVNPFNSSIKKDNRQLQTSQRQIKPFSKQQSKHPNLTKFKTKDSYDILQSLEEIHSELIFNQYDVFPVEHIEKAKRNIQDLLMYLGDTPICRKHRDLLNLYCQSDKQVICVSCVYKGSQHKGHKVKSLDTVQKVLDMQTIRNQQKSKGLVHQLARIKQQIDQMTKQIGQNYMNISKYTTSIIQQTINQLNHMRTQMQKRLTLSYQRTVTVINRYSDSLDMIINHIDKNMQKTTMMNSLSKYMLLKQLTTQHKLIQSLVGQFNQNKVLMEQWYKSNQNFQKIILRKRNNIKEKVDAFVVTEF